VFAILRPSSPAKAGDQVFRDASDGIGNPQRTGYPAFAGYDGFYGAAPCTTLKAVIALLDRATQYSKTSVIESKSRGVLDTPLEPVIGRDSRDPLARTDDLGCFAN
jgi:hypothetical protein